MRLKQFLACEQHVRWADRVLEHMVHHDEVEARGLELVRNLVEQSDADVEPLCLARELCVALVRFHADERAGGADFFAHRPQQRADAASDFEHLHAGAEERLQLREQRADLRQPAPEEPFVRHGLGKVHSDN